MRHFIHVSTLCLLSVNALTMTPNREATPAKHEVTRVATLESTPAKQEVGEVLENGDRCAPMFVAVLTTPEAVSRRDDIRVMWRAAHEDWGNVVARFALCKLQKDGTDMNNEAIQAENMTNQDIMLIDCQEGYADGALTKKVRAAMTNFVTERPEFTFFMKVDDDTFVSTRRVCDLFTWRRDADKNNLAAYFGVFAEGPHEAVDGEHRPIRDPTSPWYESFEVFPEDAYPVSAKGGPGYILSRDLVEPIIEQGIAESNELNNEDKAVGVWVDKLVQQGQQIDIVNLVGTDGYEEHKESYNTTGSYKSYRLAVHHHLSGAQIGCLNKVDRLKDPLAPIDECFEEDPTAVVTVSS